VVRGSGKWQRVAVVDSRESNVSKSVHGTVAQET
jgi:hypothetical protein